MKVVHILDGLVNSILLEYNSKSEIPSGTFSEEYMNDLVDAPDYVFYAWAYIEGKFIEPETPEGFTYDYATGTFYPTGANLLGYIQKQTYDKTYMAVVDGLITKEVFKIITGEDFIDSDEPPCEDCP